ncbi:hypothetical protein GCM10007147_01580 [Nocardiopsis kunsanensis]|uniref:NodB homology domain-containing protein n=1 Tax=Nocardiopsis kunsanensis TaxID=141693 RepID=A0A918X630_9ACTN|nr:polysaccharide deacetylase family protein [Nocardiopsis kunsanensis]GHD14970.1 hypothetical protein GCM10007147_01580 [Nocardiopsis kunsanensis]
MSSTRAHQNKAVPEPGRRVALPWLPGVTAMVLLMPLAGCGVGGSASGDPDAMAVLVDGTGENSGSTDHEGVTVRTGDADSFDDHPYIPGGVDISVAYPEFEGAEPFSEGLAERVDTEVADFRAGTRDPVALTVDWQITAAAPDVLGVRLVRTEEDMHGLREGYSTHWYDAASGHTAYSTELLADQEALETVNGLVRDQLADDGDVDTATLHPVLRTYDSMGFNDAGELVVEFDDGHLSPVVEGHVPSSEPGRKTAVLDAEEVDPLLSDLGQRAREASLSDEEQVTVAAAGPEAGEPGPVPGVVSAQDPDVDCYEDGTRCIALTFDDGPHEHTPELLDLLSEEDVTASFFLNGNPALSRPGTIRHIYAEGHEVASHNDLHENMPEEFDEEELPAQVAAVSSMVRRQTGHSVELFRPPFGAGSEAVLEEIGEQGMAEILWNVDSDDWQDVPTEQIVANVVSGAAPNTIVLLHDPLETTMEAVPQIIEELRALDYEFVSVSQALGGAEAGESYPPGGLGAPAP